jgi:hypothetical protein
MIVWIKAENDAESSAFKFVLVLNREEASHMLESNAREALKGAGRDFSDYTWNLVPSSIAGKFLLQGNAKSR